MLLEFHLSFLCYGPTHLYIFYVISEGPVIYISLRFIISALAGDDIIGFVCLFVCLFVCFAVLVALCWIISDTFLFSVSISYSSSIDANLFVQFDLKSLTLCCKNVEVTSGKAPCRPFCLSSNFHIEVPYHNCIIALLCQDLTNSVV